MARTAHHARIHREGRPLVGLRYARGRPPERVVRRVRVHELARVLVRDGSLGAEAAVAERRERCRARRAVGLTRRAVTADGHLVPDAAEEVVWPSGRHRRGALWSV
ncbi:hypothetical protein ACOQFV_28985 [Nocardiopsis changdeensis]|uniref:Uncharacterized protein n=1 Tax=Nocardiopsis changdeensis TaxID=2831969 RepID=A0ABX8BPW9_9ACTN|nr:MULTISPECIES: hypothetical protein [Nocardiopsis]QUX24285.1 hypothetical protein KGD84_08355 [Nocardiopsis changdeensis]QYX34677.1 hypothetical protein K1J57_17815 [Nocardiopsis sp. MT53]